MGFFDRLRALLGPRSDAEATSPAFTAGDDSFIYVMIPEPIGPMDRGQKYEDPLIELMESAGVGEVSGGGTQLGDLRPDGTRPIEFCGIDVDSSTPDRARELLRRELPRLGAPAGTEIRFSRAGRKLKDRLTEAGWLTDQAAVD